MATKAKPAKKPARTPARSAASAQKKPGSGFASGPIPKDPNKPDPNDPMSGMQADQIKQPVPLASIPQKPNLLAHPPAGVQNAEPVKAPRTSFTQLGSHGLYKPAGLIYDDINKDLNGLQGFAKYRELADNSAVAGACLLAIETLIRKVPWSVEPGDHSVEEQYRAQAIESMFHDMSNTWADTVTEILTMLVFGFSWLECVYKIRRGPKETDRKYNSKYSDGLIAWRKWVLIPQETLWEWEFDDEGAVSAMHQRAPDDFGTVRKIPIDKSLLFRTKTTKNNPQGKSLLRSAIHPWTSVKRIMEYEGIGIERDLTGLPLAKVPPEILDPNAPQEDKTQLEYIKKVVQNVRQNSLAGIIFPLAYDDKGKPLYEFDLISTGGMKQFDTGKIIERYERRIAMAMLADFVMMGHERVGSLALSKDKVTLVGRLIAALVEGIAAIINQHAITRIYDLNGWDSVSKARLVPGDLENADIKNMGVYVRNLMSVGALTPDPKLESSLREFAGLPPQDPAYMQGPPMMSGVDPNDMSDDAPDDGEEPDPRQPGEKPDDGSQSDEQRRQQGRGKPNPRAITGDEDSSRPSKPRALFPGVPRNVLPKVRNKSIRELLEANLVETAQARADMTEFAKTVTERLAKTTRPQRITKINVEAPAPAAAPTVNITAEMPASEPTPIEIKNTVDVAAPVPHKMKVKRTRRVKRDTANLIDKITETETHTPVAA